MSTTEIVPRGSPGGELRRVTEEDFLPLLSVKKAIARKDALNGIIQDVLIEGVDYGTQPGVASGQKVLKKSGAEKLCSVFGLAPRIIKEEIEEDWTGERHNGEPFFYYKYTIGLYRGDLFLGEAGGSCNSWESKYRWKWVSESEVKDRPDLAKLLKRGGKRKLFEPEFALDKMETTGKYGKPMEHWQKFKDAVATGAPRIQKQLGKRMFWGYEIEIDDTLVRIPNLNPADVVNTVQKMAYKRALVAPVLVVTNCSDAFTQDLDEESDDQPHFTGPAEPPADAPPPSTEPPSGPPPQPELFDTPAQRQIPEELEIVIAAVKRDPQKELKRAYDLLWSQFQNRGAAAILKYEDMNKGFRNRFPKGSAMNLSDHVDHILNLWDALQKFPEVVQA